MPIGMGVELVRLSALQKAAAESTDPYDHEHVCPYLYRNPASFRLELLACPAGYGLAQTRLTVDTQEDYQRMQTIYAELGPEPSDAGIMAYLESTRTGRTDV
jgi:spore coat polysaccharide biosynthesis protein SpsF